MVSETGFDSHGTRCAAWYLEATSDALTGSRGRPCVVMGHGFGATRDAGLLPFAERFAAAGADVLVFDYRGYGTSDGTPRQNVWHVRHREDYHAAIAHARGLAGVDADRIVLWGSSYSGGHVVPVAAKDGQVAAVISQGAAMDGLAALLEIGRYAGVGQLLKLTGHALRDIVGSLLGREPHLIPVVGPPGSLAAITADGAETGYRSIMGPTFRNEMCARGALLIPLNRPVTAASKLRAPIFLVVAADDNIAPPSAVRAVAAKAGAGSEILELPSGHFDIYSGEMFQRSVDAQVAFLQRTLRVEAVAG
ncbi:alpha/beta hydrolase [Pseudonocardia petroleophila]|uniref:Alpha/beta fold hydrolase n=1 Tax=Pseudonocardia petroleophila TaxID=37331 RepID=A0A7G7MFG9_9PSEU|nr:alpha/beta fold hydrolase [Pseudonocardia petroleophila]QNG51530.1 alpha/beta fold hydrolase [Pseudonocardia petroleophila]